MGKATEELDKLRIENVALKQRVEELKAAHPSVVDTAKIIALRTERDALIDSRDKYEFANNALKARVEELEGIPSHMAGPCELVYNDLVRALEERIVGLEVACRKWNDLHNELKDERDILRTQLAEANATLKRAEDTAEELLMVQHDLGEANEKLATLEPIIDVETARLFVGKLRAAEELAKVVEKLISLEWTQDYPGVAQELALYHWEYERAGGGE